MDVTIVMRFFVRDSGGQAFQLPCNDDAAKPCLVDFLRFLDQDVSGTDRPEVSRAHGKNLALPLIRGIANPCQRRRRRAGNGAALAGVNLATRVVDRRVSDRVPSFKPGDDAATGKLCTSWTAFR